MNILSWTVEDWYWFCQVFSLILLGATVVLGAGALFAGHVLNKRQAAEMLTLSTKLEEQREKTEQQREKVAQTELRLEEVRKAQEPRRISGIPFGDALKDKRKPAKLDIMFVLDDGEAFLFATSIFIALKAAGWDAPVPSGIPENVVTGVGPVTAQLLKMIPATLRVGGQPTGVSIVGRSIPDANPGEGDIPMNSLRTAFLRSGFGVGCGTDEAMADDSLRIVVGARP